MLDFFATMVCLVGIIVGPLAIISALYEIFFED